MNRNTFTSKTGLTAIFSILGMGFGIYTGTVPIAAGAQGIITGLLGLFLRDAVANNADELRKNTVITEAARDAAADSNAAAQQSLRTTDRIEDAMTDSKGGA